MWVRKMEIHKTLNGQGQCQALTIRIYVNSLGWNSGSLINLVYYLFGGLVCLLLTNHSSHLNFLNLYMLSVQ